MRGDLGEGKRGGGEVAAVDGGGVERVLVIPEVREKRGTATRLARFYVNTFTYRLKQTTSLSTSYQHNSFPLCP